MPVNVAFSKAGTGLSGQHSVSMPSSPVPDPVPMPVPMLGSKLTENHGAEHAPNMGLTLRGITLSQTPFSAPVPVPVSESTGENDPLVISPELLTCTVAY